MTIKKHGGIFGRNPTFNDVNVDGDLTVSGNLSANIEATTVTADSTVPLTVNRTGSQGDTIQIEDDGTKIGTVGVKNGALFLADVSGTGLRFESNGIVMTDGDGDKVAASYSLGLGAYPIGSIFLGSGHGIYMDGNNGTANFFDDYEEGTFDVTLVPITSGSITLDSSNNALAYTKIGRAVTVTGAIVISSVGSPVGDYVNVVGLPFNIGNFTDISERFAPSITYRDNSASTFLATGGIALAGESQFRIQKSANTFGANDDIYFNFTYFV